MKHGSIEIGWWYWANVHIYLLILTRNQLSTLLSFTSCRVNLPGISRDIDCQHYYQYHHHHHHHHHLNHRQHHQHLLREDLTSNANIVSHGPDQVNHCVLLRLGQGVDDENNRVESVAISQDLGVYFWWRKSISLPDKAPPSRAIKEAPHLIVTRPARGWGLAMKRQVLGTTAHYRLAIAVIKNDLKFQRDSWRSFYC